MTGPRTAPSNLKAVQVVAPERVPAMERGSAVTIGAYDGVHRGHAHVLATLRARADRDGLQVVVVTFDRHPRAVLHPDEAPLLLTDLDQKVAAFDRAGVDVVCIVSFDAARSSESANAFVEDLLVRQLHAAVVMVGEDFRFGHDREGDVDLLRREGLRHGFEVVPIPLANDGDGAISSTRIRRAVADGDVATAASLLGRPFSLRGLVVHGDGRGGPELGFATANLSVDANLAQPGVGIYAAWATLEDGSTHRAAVSIGRRPTFYTDAAPLVEAHLLDFDGDLYGTVVDLAFVERLRGEERYATVGALVDQIGRDVEATRRVLVERRDTTA